jgi:hypothetical protein
VPKFYLFGLGKFMNVHKAVHLGILVVASLLCEICFSVPSASDQKPLIPGPNAGATGNTIPAMISSLNTYPEYPSTTAGGDIAFTLAAPANGCNGYWVSPTFGGWRQTYSLLLLALAAQKQVQVYFDAGSMWGGGILYCKVYSVFIVP